MSEGSQLIPRESQLMSAISVVGQVTNYDRSGPNVPLVNLRRSHAVVVDSVVWAGNLGRSQIALREIATVLYRSGNCLSVVTLITAARV